MLRSVRRPAGRRPGAGRHRNCTANCREIPRGHANSLLRSASTRETRIRVSGAEPKQTDPPKRHEAAMNWAVNPRINRCSPAHLVGVRQAGLLGVRIRTAHFVASLSCKSRSAIAHTSTSPIVCGARVVAARSEGTCRWDGRNGQALNRSGSVTTARSGMGGRIVL